MRCNPPLASPMRRRCFETINVSKTFGAFKALSNVSFRVSDGEFVSIVGPNGAGKTTLVNVVTGLLRPTAGEVRFLGRDIAGVGPVELARLGMSRAFQLVNIFPGADGARNAGGCGRVPPAPRRAIRFAR